MATLKYKDGSEWKEFDFQPGAAIAPTSFDGVTPAALKRWANDCKKRPELYTQLLGQELTVQYSTVTTYLKGNWRLVGLNKNNAGFVFMASPYINGITNFISNNTNIEYYNQTALHTALNSTYFNYFTEEWKNIIADSSIKYISKYDTANPQGTISTLDNVKLYLPSFREINTDKNIAYAPDNATIEGTTFDYFINNSFIYFILGKITITSNSLSQIWTRTISESTNYNLYVTGSVGQQINENSQGLPNQTYRNNKYLLPICFGV